MEVAADRASTGRAAMAERCSQISESRCGASGLSGVAAWVSVTLTIVTIGLLISLHVLSPEFAPSWRVISEYALGKYAWVLSLMFVCMGGGSIALTVAVWSAVPTRAGKAGLLVLLLSGCGGAMASYFDIRHEVGHMVAGLMGVIGFPIAAMLISVSLGRVEAWRGERRRMLWLANLSWICVVLLAATLVIMTVQVSHAYGGHLPQHAPSALPSGVWGLDGWADRMIVVCNCAWVWVMGRHAAGLGAGADSKAAAV
jgi:hypothetical protein